MRQIDTHNHGKKIWTNYFCVYKYTTATTGPIAVAPVNIASPGSDPGLNGFNFDYDPTKRYYVKLVMSSKVGPATTGLVPPLAIVFSANCKFQIWNPLTSDWTELTPSTSLAGTVLLYNWNDAGVTGSKVFQYFVPLHAHVIDSPNYDYQDYFYAAIACEGGTSAYNWETLLFTFDLYESVATISESVEAIELSVVADLINYRRI
jgi:hypothetical protein